MKDRFGRPKGPSKEDIEREAERELSRLTRNQAVPPPGPGGFGGGGIGGPGGGVSTPLDEIASNVRGGRASVPEPNLGVLGSIGGGPGGYRGGPGDFDRGLGGYGGPSARRAGGGGGGQGPAAHLPADFEDPDEESATITELALRDLAARDGANPEDLVIRHDPMMAEAMRDEAMRRFMDRQQYNRPAAPTAPVDPANTVLGRLAARRKAAEEGRTLDEDEPPSGSGGLLDRLRQREQAQQAHAAEDAGVAQLDEHRRRAGYQIDDDQEPQGGLRARPTARRRDEMDASGGSTRVFEMPSSGGAEDQPRPVPELAAMASRLTQARAKAARKKFAKTSRATAAAGPAGGKGAAKKAAAKKTSAKGPVKKAAAKKAAARKSPVRTAVAKKAPVKRMASKKAAPARKAGASKTRAAPLKHNDVTTKRASKATKAPAKKASRRR